MDAAQRHRDEALRRLALWPLLAGLPMSFALGFAATAGLGHAIFYVGILYDAVLPMAPNIILSMSVGLVVQLLAMVLVLRVVLRRVGVGLAACLRERSLSGWAVGVLPGLLMGAAWILIDRITPPPLAWQYFGEAPIPWQALVCLSLFPRVLLGPLVEELYYRSALLPALMGRIGTAGAVTISSLVFTIGHTQFYDTPVHLVVVCGVSVAASLLYLRWRSTLLCFAFHAVVNLLMLVHAIHVGCQQASLPSITKELLK